MLVKFYVGLVGVAFAFGVIVACSCLLVFACFVMVSWWFVAVSDSGFDVVVCCRIWFWVLLVLVAFWLLLILVCFAWLHCGLSTAVWVGVGL